jgi:hypothetical protein
MQQLWGRRGPADGDCPTVPEGMTARDVYAKIVQEQLGAQYDQDTANMAAQTKGFKTCAKGGQTMGNYQEVRVRHVHKRVKDFLED